MSSALIWGMGLGALLTLLTGVSSYLYLRYLRTLVRAHMYLTRLMQNGTCTQQNMPPEKLTFLQVVHYSQSNEAFAYLMENGLAEEMLNAARSEGFGG